MEKPENPQAFPVSTIDGHTNDGMTLRDYFAAKIIQGMVATDMKASVDGDYVALTQCKTAYVIADSMLKARE